MKPSLASHSKIARRRARPLWAGLAFLLCYSSVQATDLVPLGRLLTTPTQRAQLDQLRKNTGKAIPQSPQNEDEVIVMLPNPNKPAAVATTPSAIPEAPKVIVFNGYVKRSDGVTTTWLNQQALTQTPASAVAHNKVSDRQLQVYLPNGKYLSAKPGQTINPGEARIEDDLSQGSISIKQPLSTTSERRP